MSDDPIKRFTLLVLFQAHMDGASELVIGTMSAEGSPIRYKVGDTWHDLSPPPSHILPGVVAQLERLAGLRLERPPKEGTINLDFSGVRLAWRIRMAGPDAAWVLTPLRQ
jgi:type II secretory ATPase GspE/PulE/Tfp pilus assembly ATPase PilB-like protein